MAKTTHATARVCLQVATAKHRFHVEAVPARTGVVVLRPEIVLIVLVPLFIQAEHVRILTIVMSMAVRMEPSASTV